MWGQSEKISGASLAGRVMPLELNRYYWAIGQQLGMEVFYPLVETMRTFPTQETARADYEAFRHFLWDEVKSLDQIKAELKVNLVETPSYLNLGDSRGYKWAGRNGISPQTYPDRWQAETVGLFHLVTIANADSL